jgi:transposase
MILREALENIVDECPNARREPLRDHRLGTFIRRGTAEAVKRLSVNSLRVTITRAASMRFVPINSVEQQSALMLHRTRDLLIHQRTQLINALRAHFAELGLVAAKGHEGLQ